MYARVFTFQFKPGMVDESIRIWHEAALPVLKEQPGFKGTWVFGERKTGRGLAFTLWETEADASAMDTSGGSRKAVGQFAEVLAAPPVREDWEVFVHV